MSSIAGPSSHAYSSFSVRPQQPPAISTKLRRVADVESATPSSAATPATNPPTPLVRAQSVADTETREQSQDRQLNGTIQRDANGSGHAEPKRPQDVKTSIAADLDAARARATAWSRKQNRTIEEETAMAQTAARIASRLAEDQRAALAPDVETPFVDEIDVVKRLLPYHIFQQPKEDLDAVLRSGNIYPSRKGKRKATEEDLLREEIADTKFALECWKRRRAIEKRLRKARIDSGKRASPDDQAYVLAQAILEVERTETANLQQELRAARQELDKIEREKRLAAPPPQPSAPVAAAQKPTMNVRTPNYYNPSTTSTPTRTPTTATFMPPYRPYSYSYSQYPTTQYTYNPHAYSATQYASTASNPYGTSPQTSATSTPAYTPGTSAATITPTSAASAQVQQAQAQPSSATNTAIPVQLPVSSLNALSALGIVPVAAASVAPGGPQPPAVIKSTNGSMLNLEINLSLLQSAQMSGLALILNALTSRGVNVDGSGAGTGTTAPSSTNTMSNTYAPAPTTNGVVSTSASAAAANAAQTANAGPANGTAPSASANSAPPAAVQSANSDTASAPSATSAGPASAASTSSPASASPAPPQP